MAATTPIHLVADMESGQGTQLLGGEAPAHTPSSAQSMVCACKDEDGPWGLFREAMMACLPQEQRTEENLRYFNGVVSAWTPPQELRNRCTFPAQPRETTVCDTTYK